MHADLLQPRIKRSTTAKQNIKTMRPLINIDIYPFMRTIRIRQEGSDPIALTYEEPFDHWGSFTLAGKTYDFQLDYNPSTDVQNYVKVYENEDNLISINKPLSRVWVRIFA